MGISVRHLLGIEQLSPTDITTILDLAESYVSLNRQATKHSNVLAGLTQINMFFENSTRTQASFELAGKRLGADVMNMALGASSIKKGETLVDTALTLNAMNPDLLVMRHPQSGAVELLSEKVNCAVLNAGDGSHEHPTQALLDALTIRRAKGRLHRLSVAICGDIAHSRVARSNIFLLNKMESTMAFNVAKGVVGAKALPHYPAPMEAIRVMEESARLSRDEALKIEHDGFVNVCQTSQARAMVQIFLSDQLLKGKAKKSFLLLEPNLQSFFLYLLNSLQ